MFFRLVTSRAPLWSWVLRILWYVQTTPQSSAVYKPSGPTSSSCGPQRGRPPSINLPVSPASFCLHRPRGTPNPHRTPHSLHYILQANNEWPEGKLRDDSLRLTLTQRLCFLHISTGLNIWFGQLMCLKPRGSFVNYILLTNDFAGVPYFLSASVFVYLSERINRWTTKLTVMLLCVSYGIVNIYIFLDWIFSVRSYLREHLTKASAWRFVYLK